MDETRAEEILEMLVDSEYSTSELLEVITALAVVEFGAETTVQMMASTLAGAKLIKALAPLV